MNKTIFLVILSWISSGFLVKGVARDQEGPSKPKAPVERQAFLQEISSDDLKRSLADYSRDWVAEIRKAKDQKEELPVMVENFEGALVEGTLRPDGQVVVPGQMKTYSFGQLYQGMISDGKGAYIPVLCLYKKHRGARAAPVITTDTMEEVDRISGQRVTSPVIVTVTPIRSELKPGAIRKKPKDSRPYGHVSAWTADGNHWWARLDNFKFKDDRLEFGW